MKTIQIDCAHCAKPFNKVLKEYTRQRKRNPNYKFYCSLKCSGKESCAHFNSCERYVFNQEQRRYAAERAREVNTKYIGDDRYFREYIRRSESRRKNDCDLTIPYLKSLWEEQNGKCAISGIPLKHINTTKSHIYRASLDRKDNSKGYTQGNVQFLSCSINYAKNTMTDEQAHDLMKAIVENYQLQSRFNDAK